MANKQITGMRGVYLVAAELSKRGFIVSPTSRGAQGADLLVTDQQCQKVFTVQVKTDGAGTSFWLVGKKVKETVSPSHIYVLVRIRYLKGEEIIEFYIVKSARLEKLAYHEGDWPNVKARDLKRYKDKWAVFGAPDDQET